MADRARAAHRSDVGAADVASRETDDRAEPVYLVKGDDASIVAQAVSALVTRLVGARDPALVVEEHGGPGADELDVGGVVDACTTPSFLVDRRVVVVRDAGRLTAADAARLVPVLEQPLKTTVLVLVSGGGTVPRPLVTAVGRHGQVLDRAVGTGRDRTRWLAEHVRDAPVRLDSSATARLGAHLGEDLGRLAGILDTLAAAYGEGATVSAAELEPYLGTAGGVPPWDLTDAIDKGATEQALVTLHRMLEAGGRAAPEIIALLHRHYEQMLRLDGATIVSAEEAAGLLGVRSAFVAKKAMTQCRVLGSERIARAISLLAAADLDVKGRSGLAPELVLDILVARLSRLVRSRAAARR